MHKPWKPLVRLQSTTPVEWIRINERQEVRRDGVWLVMLWINNAGDSRIIVIVDIKEETGEHVSKRYATEAEATAVLPSLMNKVWPQGWLLSSSTTYSNGRLFLYSWIPGHSLTPTHYNCVLFPPEPYSHKHTDARCGYCHMHEQLGM